ncbi:neuropilin-1a isoform X4 [Pangasianodon hypophthalmus]|uniref:neuropilin-1a isoform X4 n=1 Tax=Pangasianodon hypophthalmus TaxID=310915 RepID=UPI0023073025|nr:neuropilin-1a isoform X4 [Pangasianodon hypophthalmus]
MVHRRLQRGALLHITPSLTAWDLPQLSHPSKLVLPTQQHLQWTHINRQTSGGTEKSEKSMIALDRYRSSTAPCLDNACGGNITITSAGYVTSPGYPSGYPLSQQCVWLISAPDPHQRILINFNPHFDLESRECKYDFLEVYDGDSEKASLVGKYCGKIAPSPITSSGNLLLIKFTSDYETTGAGFSIRYEVHRAVTECSRNFTALSGLIQTPGFPDKYPNNLECTFIIFAPKMSEIVLEFESFDMEPDITAPAGASCRFDYLEVWDGYPTDNAITKEGFSSNYRIRSNQEPSHEQANECLSPLGMESGEISDERIAASSQYNPSWSPFRSRLNYHDNGWTPSEDSAREWIQVDLGFLRYVSAIGTQGAISKETKKAYYVKTYKVSISTNGEDWIMVKDGTKHKVFHGSHNPTDEAHAFFPKPTLTRYIRIRPLTWEHGICMRFELYGCKISDSPCSSMLGMVSGQILDSQISVWPEVERGWLPEQARLLTGRSGWVAPVPHGTANSSWLAMDLGFTHWVTAVILQGGRHRDKVMFVRRFKLAYSTNGSDWSYIHEENSTKAKVFMGNQNHDTPEVRSFKPLMMRFLRVYPERGSHDGMALRLELLGCDTQRATPLPPTTTMVTTVRVTANIPATSPAIAGITTTEDCDDESATCHSGTGTSEDYEPTGTVAEPMESAYLWFDCNFGWSDHPSFCGWSLESIGQVDWLLQNHDMPSKHQLPNVDYTGEPGNFIYTALTRDSLYPETEKPLEQEIEQETQTGRKRGMEGERTAKAERQNETESKVRLARLVSLPVTSPDEDLCVSFWYRFTGEHKGALHIWQKTEGGGEGVGERGELQEEGKDRQRDGSKKEQEVLLWRMEWQETKGWKEGRVLMPHADKPYKVIIEGVVDSTLSGHISLDNVKIVPEMSAAECKDPEFEVTTRTAKPAECDVEQNSKDFVWRFGLRGGSMLKTLNPILITIIVMSAVGVLLGAVCVAVLYCACSHNPEQTVSALENYKFELVDGLKLKQEKVSAQKSYTEA